MKSTKIIVNTILMVVFMTLIGCSITPVTKPIDLTETFSNKAEVDRLRYFREINAVDAFKTEGLTGDGVRVTIMGEMVDATHPDIKHAVNAQYNAFVKPSKFMKGLGNQAWGAEKFEAGDGHGTHIAGTIAAACDNIGVQGLACNSSLDVYDLGAYESAQNWLPSDTSESEFFAGFLQAFTAALNDVTRRGESKIITGSFNLESPAILYREDSLFYSQPAAEIVELAMNEFDDADDMFDGGYAIPVNPKDKSFIKRMISKNNQDPMIALQSSLVLSKEWSEIEDAVSAYQKSGGVYLVTESNYNFEDHTSTLNALPTLSPKVDPDLWLSVVMVVPEGMDQLSEDISSDEFNHWLTTAAYTTPINSCGDLAAEYCLVTPSYTVLSTVTDRVAESEEPIIFINGRTYQSFSGHSMGAPMVASALALMEEQNLRKGYEYTMKDLVSILKKSANKSFTGYDKEKHGVGMLDITSAIRAMGH